MKNQRVIVIAAFLIVATFAVLGGSLLFRGDPEDEPTEIAPTSDHSDANSILSEMDEVLRDGALAHCAEFESETGDSEAYVDCLRQYLEDNQQEVIIPADNTTGTTEAGENADTEGDGADTDEATGDE